METQEEITAATSKVNCKNCKTSFNGKFCPECGQSVFEYQRPFRFLLADFTGNLFAFDTRFWKSLKALTIKPGTLTRDFIEGKRARYMPPFRFFIFISFLFFLIFSSYLGKAVVVSEENKALVYKALQQTDSIAKKETELSFKDSIQTPLNNSFQIEFNSGGQTGEEKTEEDLEEIEKLKAAVVTVMENPRIYMNSFLKFLSWSLFLLMPVYAFILWLFFRKSNSYYYSHLIMAVNQHSFWFITLTLIFMFQFVFPKRNLEIELFLLLLLPIHTFFGYKQLYRRGWFKTLIRSVGILFTYGLCLLFAIGAIFSIWIKAEFL